MLWRRDLTSEEPALVYRQTNIFPTSKANVLMRVGSLHASVSEEWVEACVEHIGTARVNKCFGFMACLA